MRKPKKGKPLKFRTVIKGTKTHKDKTKYNRKGKWAKRKGFKDE